VEVNPLRSATPAHDVAPDTELRTAVLLHQGRMFAATRSHQEETKRLMDEQGRLREEQSKKDASREAMVALMKENQILRDVKHQKHISEMETDRAVVARNETVPVPAQICRTFFAAPSAASSIVVSNSSLEMSPIGKANSEVFSSLNFTSSFALR
jgi:hypothetical protein